MANYDLGKYKELLEKTKELQRYLFVVAKPVVDADYQKAINKMSSHCSPYMDALAPDPFDPDVELLHSIGRARGIIYQMVDFLGMKLETFINIQQTKTSSVKTFKKKKHHRY